jgi:hypothetical protein
MGKIIIHESIIIHLVLRMKESQDYYNTLLNYSTHVNPFQTYL